MQNNILKNYIEQKGLPLRELSEKSGINISRLSRASNSKRRSVDITLELAFALGDTKVSVNGIESGKESYLSFEIQKT